MSDEERIEQLELKVKVLRANNKRLKDKIDEQSKKIEELKTQIDEHVYYDLGGRSCGKTELLRNYKKGYDMNNKFWKDKIKAKIEEYREQIEELKDLNIFTYTEYEGAIKFGQSLLEKE